MTRISLTILIGVCLQSLLLLADPPEIANEPNTRLANARVKSRTMLQGAWVPDDHHLIDFDNLPHVPSQHVVVSDVRGSNGVNQHNYLAHHDGKYWIMWSDGPGVEDQVGQRVKYATSPDGLRWSESAYITPVPPNSGIDSPVYGTRSALGFRWISRGLWPCDGELIALASLDEAAGFFGASLELHAFKFNPVTMTWDSLGVIANDTINNFPPKQLSDGQWMMSRRTHDYKTKGVQFLIGGTEQLDRWESFQVLGSNTELAAEEPFWWTLPDNSLMALFRDNRRSGYLFRSFSSDAGRTWSRPVKTDFPDATSKMHGLRIRGGRYILVSNPKPGRRDPLVISVSDDGVVFNKMAYLIGGRRVDYPHVIDHQDHLLIAFSGGKQTVEVLKIKVSDVDQIANTAHGK